jgi:hypothetical protein
VITKNLNPATKIKSISVYNMVKLVKELQFSRQNQSQLDLSNLPDGLYLLQIGTSGGEIYLEKIVLF